MRVMTRAVWPIGSKPCGVRRGRATAAEDGCVPLTGVQILRSLDFDPDSTWPLFGLLVLVTCAYRFVSFLGLHFLHTGQTYKERWNKLFDA